MVGLRRRGANIAHEESASVFTAVRIVFFATTLLLLIASVLGVVIFAQVHGTGF